MPWWLGDHLPSGNLTQLFNMTQLCWFARGYLQLWDKFISLTGQNKTVRTCLPFRNRHYTEFPFAISINSNKGELVSVIQYTHPFLLVKSSFWWNDRKATVQEEKQKHFRRNWIVKDCWLLKSPLCAWIMSKELFIPTTWCRKLTRNSAFFLWLRVWMVHAFRFTMFFPNLNIHPMK